MVLFLALSAVAAGQAVGDTMKVKVYSAVDLDLKVTDGRGERQHELSVKRDEEFQQSVTKAGDGRIDEVQIRCLSSKSTKGGDDVALSMATTGIEGKTFKAMRTEDGWKVTDENDLPVPPNARSLGVWNDLNLLLPGQAPKKGESWSVEAASVLKLFSPSPWVKGDGKVDCTCDTSDGSRVTVVFQGELSGTGETDEQRMVLTIAAGKLVYDLQARRPVSLSFSGSLRMEIDIMGEYIRPIHNKPGERKKGEGKLERYKVGLIEATSRSLRADFTFE